MMKKITEYCSKCHSTDLWGGYDLMLSLKDYNDHTLTLEDYQDGSFNEYTWCTQCDDECMETYTKEQDDETQDTAGDG